jgi:hypothetical protein
VNETHRDQRRERSDGEIGEGQQREDTGGEQQQRRAAEHVGPGAGRHLEEDPGDGRGRHHDADGFGRPAQLPGQQRQQRRAAHRVAAISQKSGGAERPESAGFVL